VSVVQSHVKNHAEKPLRIAQPLSERVTGANAASKTQNGPGSTLEGAAGLPLPPVLSGSRMDLSHIPTPANNRVSRSLILKINVNNSDGRLNPSEPRPPHCSLERRDAPSRPHEAGGSRTPAESRYEIPRQFAWMLCAIQTGKRTT